MCSVKNDTILPDPVRDAADAVNAVSEPQASRYIRMSVPWLRQQRMRGRGPAYVRIGRSIRYRLSDLDAYLAAHRVEPRELDYTIADVGPLQTR